VTKEERNKYQREYRIRTGNRGTKAYEKTIKGFIMRQYRNIKSRIEGVQRHNAHLYAGKYLMPKEEYYNFAINDPDFNRLWVDYVASGYDSAKAPSPDRKDTTDGYRASNIRFITALDNALQGLSEWRKKRNSR